MKLCLKEWIEQDLECDKEGKMKKILLLLMLAYIYAATPQQIQDAKNYDLIVAIDDYCNFAGVKKAVNN